MLSLRRHPLFGGQSSSPGLEQLQMGTASVAGTGEREEEEEQEKEEEEEECTACE